MLARLFHSYIMTRVGYLQIKCRVGKLKRSEGNVWLIKVGFNCDSTLHWNESKFSEVPTTVVAIWKSIITLMNELKKDRKKSVQGVGKD